LLHDASEAYLSDITRPVKRQLKEYLEIEEVVQGAVWEAHFPEPLNGEEREQVQEIDEVMLYHELFHLLEEQLEVEEPPLFAELDLGTRHFEEVEDHFLQLYNKLREELQGC
jgi:5'-deoxynucleotidase YfbR-like HD superfamily hydrolase